MSERPISLLIEGGVARFTLDNAQNRNAIDSAFVDCFSDMTQQCAGDQTVKVVVIAAVGEFFSVGGDLAEFVSKQADIRQHILRLARKLHEGIETLHRSDLPIILSLNGIAAGGGFSLVCGADIVIAARTAKLTSAYTKTGLTPDGGGTYFLERIVGYRKAFEILALNPILSAEEAKALGIVTRVVDSAELDMVTEEVVRRFLETPADAVIALKKLMKASEGSRLPEQLEREAVGISGQASDPAVMTKLNEFFR